MDTREALVFYATALQGLKGICPSPVLRKAQKLRRSSEKNYQEQTRRRNAEGRLKYSREKVEQEMKSFGDGDHKEFLFRGVELEKVHFLLLCFSCLKFEVSLKVTQKLNHTHFHMMGHYLLIQL